MTGGEIDCRAALPLLALFFDGELDPRQMRNVALHTAKCGTCQEELRGFEALRRALTRQIRAEAAGVDWARLWAGIEPRLNADRSPWYQRLLDRLDLPGEGMTWKAPVAALAGAALLAALVFGLTGGRAAQEIELADNRAIVEGVQSHVDALALLGEPESHALVLWVADQEPAASDERQ